MIVSVFNPGILIIGAVIGSVEVGKYADLVLWEPQFFGAKPKMVIKGGMIPKAECCRNAIEWGVRRVFIIDGRVPHAILIEMLTNEGIGTMFTR